MGNFEIEDSAYPIGYLNVGSGYKVTDMRNLHGLHSHPIPRDVAIRIASQTNAKLRSKELSTQDGDTSVPEFVLAEVAKLDA